MTLVCVGGEKTYTQQEKELIAQKRLKAIAFLPDEELAAAYGGARALVYLSRYEGFGLPVVEAMACGCPVIAAANRAVEEVGEKAVLYVPPDDESQLLRALEIVGDLEQRRILVDIGVRRAGCFTWEAAAARLRTLILKVCQSPLPRISALISAYNSEIYMARCLEDLQSQSLADQLEIIVIDSASAQNEGAIVHSFQQRFGNIKYVRTQRRETVYQAWNRGIKLAQGSYITNANTDDRHRHDAFEHMSTILDENKQVALVYADVIKTDKKNETFTSCTFTGILRWHAWDRKTLLEKGCFIGPQPMWRRSVHDDFGFFDERYSISADYEFWLRISQVYDFQHISTPLGLYLDRPDSVEHSDTASKRNQDMEINLLYRRALAENHILNYRPFRDLQQAALTRDNRLFQKALQQIRKTCTRLP